MSLAIRAEQGEDRNAIRAMHMSAFPTPAEADLVDAIRADRDCVLSLVAEQDGAVVGHLLLSRMAVIADGRACRAVGLAPVAVRPERQRTGIGSALIEEALRLAREAGEELAFVVGEPGYYRRFGFAPETAAPFASPYSGPHFMAKWLRDVPLPRSGRADYAPAFAPIG